MPEHESPLRSLAKSVTWRVLASLTTVMLVYLFTGELALALGVGVLEVILKFALFFVHERMWDRISWGRISTQKETGDE